jgi:hypothetical protein
VPKVFVSSTYLDNQERRKLVQEAITMAGMLWHGMEIFTASARPTVEECLRYVQEADLLKGGALRRALSRPLPTEIGRRGAAARPEARTTQPHL